MATTLRSRVPGPRIPGPRGCAHARARAALVVGATALLVTGVAGPASATTVTGPGSTYDDGEQRGTTMSIGQAVLVFVGIPLAVAALVWLLVKAPGWTRNGRPDAAGAWTEEPVSIGSGAPVSDRPGLVGSGQAAPDPAGVMTSEPDATDHETGGTSAAY